MAFSGGSNLSASLALLPLFGLGSSLTLVLLHLLRPSWSTLGRVHSVFQLWNLDSNVFHQRLPCWKFLLEKLSIRLFQLNLEPTSEHWLLALLSRVELPLHHIVGPHLKARLIQNHLDLLVVGVLHRLFLGNPSAFTDALQLVHVCRVDADEPLWLRVQLIRVERPQRWWTTILLLLLL